MSVHHEDRGPRASQRPVGRTAMLLIGFLAGLAVATIVGVVLLGMRMTTVGDADEVIGGPTTTATESTPAQDADEVEESATGTQSASGTRTAGGSGTTTAGGDVPEACVRSAEYNLTIDESLDQLALGARDEDARTIQEALDAIQGAREATDGSAQECLDLASGSGTQ